MTATTPERREQVAKAMFPLMAAWWRYETRPTEPLSWRELCGAMADAAIVTLDAEADARVEESRDEAVDFVLGVLEKALDAKGKYYPADGTETWSGDVAGTIHALLRGSGVVDEEDGAIATHAKVEAMREELRLRHPTDAMLNAARDWSCARYGKPIGNDAAIGCWQAMVAAALSIKGSPT